MLLESPCKSRASARFVLTLAIIGLSWAPVLAQDFATTNPNVNVVGLTPKLEHIPDFQLKQQQEPSCIVRPGNESYYFCAFNDLRASDLPIQNDGWIGVSYSNDFADTWYSRLAPGYLGDPNNNSIGMGFAADPTVAAIPGNSPGLAVLNYIAGFRGSSESVLAVQRFVEYPQEDLEFWKPEDGVRIVTTSQIENGFIDKPNFKYIPEDPTTQGEITQSIYIEGETTPISVTTPTGTLIVVYAVFPDGSEGSILRLRRSNNNGVTWSDAVELVDSPTAVNGASISVAGDKIIVIYRRSGGEILVPRTCYDDDDDDGDEDDCDDDEYGDDDDECDDDDGPCYETQIVSDAVVAVACDNASNIVCTEGTEVFENCPFDQPASGSTFRTSAFPWIAWDGRRIWAFQAHRNPGGACLPVDGAPGFFHGKPKIVAMSSVNGTDWVGSAANPNEPIIVAPRSEGFQVMPVSLGVKGKTWVAWTDTYREEIEGLPTGAGDILIGDYSNGAERVFRKADVWATRLEHSCPSTPATEGCTPNIENPLRVSQYPTVMETAQAEIAYEIQADFKNLRTHVSGTKAFGGDYKALAALPVRELANGKWISNEVPGDSFGPELPGFTDKQNVFIAWGSNKNVVGEFQSDPESLGALPYTPPINSPANPGGAVARFDDIDPDDIIEPTRRKMAADDEPDHAPGVLPGEDISTCVIGNQHALSRNTDVIAALIEDTPSLLARTPVKPLGGIQRMYPLEIRNIDPNNEATFCLSIANQPADFGATTGLASFYQLPAIAPFEDGDQIDLLTTNVWAGSSASRSVFVTTNDTNTIITVNAYEGACPIAPGETFGNLVNSVRVGHGLLFDPEYCKTNACDPVALNETHDITLANPGIQAPGIQAPVSFAPGIQAPGIQAPGIQAPGIQAAGFLAPGIQAPGVQAPGIQAPGVQAAQILAASLHAPGIQAPGIQAPGIQAPGIQAPGIQATALADAIINDPEDVIYQDVTYVVSTDGNVTTTYSADVAINGLPGLISSNPADVEAVVQFVAWTNAVYSTVSNDDPCLAAPGSTQQILAYNLLDQESADNLTLPYTIDEDEQNPYIGDLSFTGSSDKDIALTVRFWATGTAKDKLEQLEQDLNDCRADPFCDAESGNYGAARLINFGASAHQCSTDDAVINTQIGNGTQSGVLEDCLTNEEEKIIPDLAPPIITVPASVSTEATGPDGAVVTYSASAMDNLDANPELMCNPASGTQFALSPMGTTVSCFASDFKGNSTISTFDVFVVDTTPPVLPALPDVAEEATGASGAVISYSLPIATDVVDTAPDVSCLPAAGTTFASGSTSVECTATDDFGNSSTQSFFVTVADSTAPVLTMPTQVTVEPRVTGDPLADTYAADASGSVVVEANQPPPAGAIITFTPTATDAVDASPSITCNPPSGDTFPVGDTTVVCTASDGANVSPGGSITITVEDTTDPTFNVDDDAIFTFEANVPQGAMVDLAGSGAVVAVDRGVEILPSCEATSADGSITKTLPDYLEAGDWSVTCSVDGAVLTTVTVTVHVDIIDIEPPVLTIPGASLTVDANAITGTATVDFLANGGFGGETITAADNVDTAVEISCVPASGSTFDVLPVGQSHTVTCTAADDGPNTADGDEVNVSAEVSFELIVQDVTPPTIPMLPDPTQTDILVEATDTNGAVVSFDVSSSDVVDSAPALVCAPPPGSTFALGSTTVSCTATDFWGNESEGSFVVTVSDTTTPTLSGVPGDFNNVEATEFSGASVSWPLPTATDLVDGDVAVSCVPASGSTFGLGSTTVTCSATDSNGNSTSDTFGVSVVDTTPPAIDVPGDILASTTSPDGTSVEFSVSATDIFDVTISCVDGSGATVESGDVFPIGVTTVTCTAIDANDREASTAFDIDVELALGIRLVVPKRALKAGSSNPIDWQYFDRVTGDVIDSGHLSPMVSWLGRWTEKNCGGVNMNDGSGNDAGSSDIRYSASSKTWQFSWKTEDAPGYYLVFVTPPGALDPSEVACVRLR